MEGLTGERALTHDVGGQGGDGAGALSTTRQDFIKTAALLGGSALLSGIASGCVEQPVRMSTPGGPAPYPNTEVVN
jgi:hypothetical protein